MNLLSYLSYAFFIQDNIEMMNIVSVLVGLAILLMDLNSGNLVFIVVSIRINNLN